MKVKRIEIRDIDKIICRWKCGFDTMVNFIKTYWSLRCKMDSGQIKTWSAKVYGFSDAHNQQRIKRWCRFLDTYYSVGYKGILVNEDAFFSSEPNSKTMIVDGISVLFEGAIPRVYEDGGLDDSNHRVPTYIAFGIKSIPVAIIAHDNSGTVHLNRSMKEAFALFFKSNEWLKYKESDDYNILLTRTGKTITTGGIK